MKKTPPRRTAVLAAVAGLLLLALLALVTTLTIVLDRDGERALSGVFPAEPMIFADLSDAAGLWEVIEERGIPALLKKSRALYEAERLPAVKRLLEMYGELEGDSGIAIDGDLLMHLAGKGAAIGLYRPDGGEAPDWIALFRTTLPAWAVLRAYFLRDSAGAGGVRGEKRIYRGRRLHGLDAPGGDGESPQVFFIGDAVVAASGPAAAEAALDCFEGGEGCFRGREDHRFPPIDGERPGDLHFLVRPPALMGIPEGEPPGYPWPGLEELAVSVDIAEGTRVLFAATVEDWGALRPSGQGVREVMEAHRHVGGGNVILAAVRGASLPRGIDLFAPVGHGGEPGALEAREWVLAVRDFREKEFIPFPRALLIIDAGSAAGALDALSTRFPRSGGRSRILGFPAAVSAPVHRWGVELRPGGAVFGRYAAFAYDMALLEETISSVGQFREGGKSGGGDISVGVPSKDTLFYGSVDNVRLVAAIRRVAVPLSAALGGGGGDAPGLAADIDMLSYLHSAVIRVDGAGKSLSGEAVLRFGTR